MDNRFSLLRKYDVIFTQGVKSIIPNNEGNIAVSLMIKEKAPLYNQCTTREEREVLTMECIEEMRRTYSTRFVKPSNVRIDGDNNESRTEMQYEELPDEKILEEITHMFRFCRCRQEALRAEESRV